MFNSEVTISMSRVLERQIFVQLGKKFLTFYGARTYITGLQKSTTDSHTEPDELKP
jgi:hypothetical protein